MSYTPTHFSPLTTDLDIIQALDDLPNQTGGLTAAELKKKFDDAGNIIKDYIRDTLIKELEDSTYGTSGASGIGIAEQPAIQGAHNVEDAIAAVIAMYQAGTVGAASVGHVELKSLDDVLNPEAPVETNNIKDSAVTTAKIADDAVDADKCDFTSKDLVIGSSTKKLTIDGPLVLSARTYGDYSDRPVSPETGQIYFVKVGTTP